jgi:hypothetical protein
MNEYIYLFDFLASFGDLAVRHTFSYHNNILNEKIRKEPHNKRK